MKVILYIIMGLMALLVISALLSGGVLPLTERKEFIPESLVKTTGEPLIWHSENDEHSYTIRIDAKIEYKGKWDEEIDEVEATPLIRFKGVSEKASLDGMPSFRLSKSDPRVEGELFAFIKSKVGPIDYVVGGFYNGPMKEYQSLLITTEDNGDFLVTLENIFGVWNDAYFSVECETGYKDFVLASWVCCSETSKRYPEQYEKCEQYLELCNGEIHIRLVDSPTCNIFTRVCHTDEVLIQATGKESFDPGERVEVSLWDSNSACVNRYNELSELLSHCPKDFLGYASLKGVII